MAEFQQIKQKALAKAAATLVPLTLAAGQFLMTLDTSVMNVARDRSSCALQAGGRPFEPGTAHRRESG